MELVEQLRQETKDRRVDRFFRAKHRSMELEIPKTYHSMVGEDHLAYRQRVKRRPNWSGSGR